MPGPVPRCDLRGVRSPPLLPLAMADPDLTPDPATGGSKPVPGIGDVPTFLLGVLAVSFVLRAVAGGLLELGNDEVYYTTYARFPDNSLF